VHELSVAQALVAQVEAVISQHGATQATLIRVRIGPLAGVEPSLLGSAFPLAVAGSRLEHAVLDLVLAPVRVRCQICSAETEVELNRLVCGICGDWHTQVISGDELLLESVELETNSPHPFPLGSHS
jgi:hydrogenase nickel incorporation protein HypA/HybF